MTFPLLFQSYWRDEAFSVLLAQHSFLDIVRLVAHDFSPPLYFVILKVWITLLGSGEVATRTLSLVLYILTLITIGVFLRRYTRIHPLFIILSVSIIGCIHPLLTSYAFEARMYTFAALLAVLSWYFFLQKRWGWYMCATIAGLYTHYFMLLIVGVQGLHILTHVFIVYFRTRHNSDWKEQIVRSWKHQSIGLRYVFLSLLIFVPWTILFLYSHTGSVSQSFWIPRPSLSHLVTLPSLLVFGHDTFSNFAYDTRPFAYLVYGLVILGFLQGGRQYRSLILTLLLWSFVPGIAVWVFSQVATPLYLPRYLIVSAPAVIIMVMLSIHMFRPLTKVIFTVIMMLLLTNYLMASSRFSQTGRIFTSTKEDLRGHIYRIKSYAKPTDFLIVESELDYHVAQVYWFDPEQVRIIGKTYEEIPDYVGKILIPRRAVLTKPYPKIEGYIFKKDRKVVKFKQ